MPKKIDFAAALTQNTETTFDDGAIDRLRETFDGNLSGVFGGLAIASDGSETIIGGGLRLSPVGLQIDGELDRAQWLGLLSGLQKIERAHQWMLGDAMVYGVARKYGETGEQIAEIAEVSGKDDKTLYDYWLAARSFEISERSEKLFFEVYRVIARHFPHDDKLDVQEQSARANARRVWVQRAMDEKLSGRRLDALITGTEPVAPPPLLDKVTKRRFNRIWRMLERATPDKIKHDELRLIRAWLDEVEKTLPKKK